MKTKHLIHRNGGTISDVAAIAHETYKGVASWHFIGSIEWSDGSKSKDAAIEPFSVCYDQSKQDAKVEGDALFEKLNDYLKRHGAWHNQKRARDGRVYSWTPKKPSARLPIGETA